MTAIHAFSAKQMNGKPMPLKKFKGKALLLVNTVRQRYAPTETPESLAQDIEAAPSD